MALARLKKFFVLFAPQSRLCVCVSRAVFCTFQFQIIIFNKKQRRKKNRNHTDEEKNCELSSNKEQKLNDDGTWGLRLWTRANDNGGLFFRSKINKSFERNEWKKRWQRWKKLLIRKHFTIVRCQARTGSFVFITVLDVSRTQSKRFFDIYCFLFGPIRRLQALETRKSPNEKCSGFFHSWNNGSLLLRSFSKWLNTNSAHMCVNNACRGNCSPNMYMYMSSKLFNN